MYKSRKKFYLLLIGQMVLISTFIAYFLLDIDKLFSEKQNIITQKPTCNLAQNPCEIALKDKKINLSILPLGIPLMKNLEFIANTQNIDADILHVKIYATNMQMGTFKFELKKIKQDTYMGEQMLPTCIVGDMNWNADISSEGFENIARFSFKTEK